MFDMRSALAERIETLAKQYNVPGVAVGVDLAGETSVSCHGVTHIHHPLPVDGGTLFQIASNSKPFVATLVLGLVEEGRLNLDDPVREHLPDFRMPVARYDDLVTVRHLLTHQMGWDGDHLFVRQPKPDTLDAIFEPMAKARQLVPPGGAWTYSNAGFSVAGRLVEVLTQKPFAMALRERLLGPLGMQRTCTTADEAIFHRVAMRHLSIPGREPIPLPGGGWQDGWELVPFDVPPGGVISCVEDLLTWLRFWLGRPDPAPQPCVLGDALRRDALEPQIPPYSLYQGQAIGWEMRLDPSGPVHAHGGLTAGYCSYTLFVPKLDLAAVVLTNSTTGHRLHTDLTRWLVGEVGGTPWRTPEPLVPQPPLRRFEGSFWGSFGTTHIRATDEGDLELRTERHSTEDGSWQPPREPPMRARLHAADSAVVTDPEPVRGGLVSFDPDAEGDTAPRWIRLGGRISVRI